MPRCARWVLPGKPHHITQRGTGRQRVFYSRRDCRVYLEQLRVNAAAEHVLVLAFSLMTNHIHLIVVPPDEESLAIALRRTHGRYAQYLNARKLRTGHLWQNRCNPFGSEEFVERARQTRNTTETPLTPVAWIREPNQPCYDFSGKSAR